MDSAMFVRLLFLIAIINVCQCEAHHRRYKNVISIDKLFENIYKNIIFMDKRFNTIRKYENNNTFEWMENDWYSRKIFINGFNQDKISVKIRHRVMYTKVENIYTGRKSLEDIKVLPINLNTKEAFYEVKESKLYINIPYLEEYEDRSYIEINEDLITVPKAHNISHMVVNYTDAREMKLNVVPKANNDQSVNIIDNPPGLSCAIMVKPNPSIKINENKLREIFGEPLNTS